MILRINQARKVPKNLHWDRGTRKLLQLLIVGVAILYLIRHNTKVLNQISMTAAPEIRTSPRKVFVDLGANCGNTYLQRKKMFDAEGDWEIYLWEPSPQMHTFFLDDLARSNPDIVVVPYAAGIQEGTIPLYVHKGQEDIQKKELFKDGGRCDPTSSFNPSGGTTTFGNAKVAGKSVQVQVVDFPAWLNQMGLDRRLFGDRLILKIDIEGAELAIMEELLKLPPNGKGESNSSNICASEVIEMEFHKFIFQKNTEDYKIHEAFERTFSEKWEARCGSPPNLKKLS